MAEPATSNTGLIVPNTGDLSGTWGSGALNPNFAALDGYFGGVQAISLSNTNVTLTSPAGFTPTPSGGPTQAQNATLQFTGVITAIPTVTLPLPGYYIIDNMTTGLSVFKLAAAGGGNVIGIGPGQVQHVYNDGTNVKYVNLGAQIGQVLIWAGLSTIPTWVSQCTVKPFLVCDGTVYNVSTYPNLFSFLGGAFGGNGSTTFAVPDLRGRMAVPYDSTASRITAAGCGLSGTTIGAALDEQTIVLTQAQMPSHFHSASIFDPGHNHSNNGALYGGNASGGSGGGGNDTVQQHTSISVAAAVTGVRVNSSNGLDTTYSAGSSASHPNVQPSLVTGIAVIRAA